jgi:hypothetical protein
MPQKWLWITRAIYHDLSFVKNAEVLVTMDENRREIKGGGFYCEDGFIRDVGNEKDLPASAMKWLISPLCRASWSD